MTYDIFLSYSHEDQDWAARLYRRLRRFRISGRAPEIFFAPAAIDPGASIPRSLGDALNESSHLLAVVSGAWLSSEWCRLEDEISLWLDPVGHRRHLLPLLTEDILLPPRLARLRFIDFREVTNYEPALRELVATLRADASRRSEERRVLLDRDAVLGAPLLPWAGFGSPSFDFLWPEMIVDPMVRPRRNPGPDLRLSMWSPPPNRLLPGCFALVGEPGVGKTTALRSLLLGGGEWLPEQRVFVHARDLAAERSRLVERAAAGRPGEVAVLVDGLDEAGTANLGEVASALSSLQQARTLVVIAARTEFFDRQYETLASHLHGLTEVLEVREWTQEDIQEFTENYARRLDDPSIIQTMRSILDEVRGARPMLSNPMRLTLLLYLLATGAKVDLVDLREPYSLYNQFYTEWIRKERHRGTGRVNADMVRRAHIALARWIYRHKGEAGALVPFLESVMEDGVVDELLIDSSFTGVLWTTDGDDGRSRFIGFRHETLGEFLIAHDVLSSFELGGTAIDHALEFTVADDVNTFVRSGMLQVSQSRLDKFLTNLTSRYDRLLSPAADSSAEEEDGVVAARTREQILYYIGRLPIQTVPAVLRRAYRGEQAPLLRRSAALSAIVRGDHVIEREFMALLTEPEYARLNRSVQMVYFGDVDADLHTFVDGGEDWSKTRAAIYRRLTGRSLRDLRLRWWDLRTLRSFYASRGWADVPTAGEQQVLAQVRVFDPASETRTTALRDELRTLREELGLD